MADPLSEHVPEHQTERDRPTRPFTELRDSGLLWLINRVVFHPRGYALALSMDMGNTTTAGKANGWRLLGDGTQPWVLELPEGEEDDLFRRAEATLQEARDG